MYSNMNLKDSKTSISVLCIRFNIVTMITARAYRLIKFEFIYYEHKNTVIEICISQAFNKSNKQHC